MAFIARKGLSAYKFIRKIKVPTPPNKPTQVIIQVNTP